MTPPKVFISYSWESDEHSTLVRGLHDELRGSGCDARMDIHKDTDEDWPTWLERMVRESDFILCVITETYTRRFNGAENPDAGLGVGWEAGLIRRMLYARRLRNDRVFPVAFRKEQRNFTPLTLQGYDFFPIESPADLEKLQRKIYSCPEFELPDIGPRPPLPITPPSPLFKPGAIAQNTTGSPQTTTSTDHTIPTKPNVGKKEEEIIQPGPSWGGKIFAFFILSAAAVACSVIVYSIYQPSGQDNRQQNFAGEQHLSSPLPLPPPVMTELAEIERPENFWPRGTTELKFILSDIRQQDPKYYADNFKSADPKTKQPITALLKPNGEYLAVSLPVGKVLTETKLIADRWVWLRKQGASDSDLIKVPVLDKLPSNGPYKIQISTGLADKLKLTRNPQSRESTDKVEVFYPDPHNVQK